MLPDGLHGRWIEAARLTRLSHSDREHIFARLLEAADQSLLLGSVLSRSTNGWTVTVAAATS